MDENTERSAVFEPGKAEGGEGCDDDWGEEAAERETAEDGGNPGTGERPPLDESNGVCDAGRDQLRPIRPDAQTGPGNGLLQRARQQARRQDMERFLQAYPEVKAETIPRQVWEQVARGMPLVSAYAMHENRQLKVELAAERQNRANRQRTPGALGANSGGEPDELDRMWAEED